MIFIFHGHIRTAPAAHQAAALRPPSAPGHFIGVKVQATPRVDKALAQSSDS
jgi:hypothetical protein